MESYSSEKQRWHATHWEHDTMLEETTQLQLHESSHLLERRKGAEKEVGLCRQALSHLPFRWQHSAEASLPQWLHTRHSR